VKRTSTFQNGLIWFGAGVSLAEILTGTSFAPLGMAKGFAAILIGHIIGCAMMLLAGLIGGGGRPPPPAHAQMGGLPEGGARVWLFSCAVAGGGGGHRVFDGGAGVGGGVW